MNSRVNGRPATSGCKQQAGAVPQPSVDESPFFTEEPRPPAGMLTLAHDGHCRA
ncbi:hypothetical protein [Pseudomonas sp.]|uniref:hypothetical protein n=1 Tax=Pseudomonas sp. TaxID=306 RepID=UPI00299D9682|nr:hypothetical protein [Pseudomonas sp.]